MSVLLINPPRTIGKGNIWEKIDRSLPPLGLACIASYLEKKGRKVSILDMQAEYVTQPELDVSLKRLNPGFVGITATTVEIESALRIADLCKESLPATKVILGGAHPSVMPEEVLLNPRVDFVVRGEGEHTLHELTGGAKLSGISGLSYRQNGRIRHNPPRALINDLDKMPLPAYHLLPMDKYRPSLGNYKRLPAMSMIATRGCPGRCTFCYTGISGKTTRTRTAESLLKEIKLLQRNYKIKEISFYDDTFTAFRENVKKFCEGIIREQLNITWSCMSRIDFVDAEVLRLMRQSGCHQIGYGLESASPEILRNIGKPTSVDLMEKNIELTKKSGIDVRAMFLLGSPGETEKTLKQTINFALKIKPAIALFNITTPFPGTAMYGWAKRKNYLMDSGWNKYDLANVVMRLPTVSSETIKSYYNIAYRKFYLNPSYVLKRLLGIRTLIDFKNNVTSLLSIISFCK